MIVRNPNPPIYLSTPPPEDFYRDPTLFSDCEADDEDTMSEGTPPSRPLSYAQGGLQPPGAHNSRIPTLQEVLANTAPQPFTLSAFTAHLHHNHCLENLEFIKDVERYGRRYKTMMVTMAADAAAQRSPQYKASAEVSMLWDRLLQAYIIPDAPREVNLSGDVRDALISLPNHATPPAPESLESAVERIMELMNESIMMTFINEYTPSRASPSLHEDMEDAEERQARRSNEERHRSRSRRKCSPHGEVTSGSQHASRHSQVLTSLSRGRLAMHANNSSTGSGDIMFTDESGSLAGSPTDSSPMTPPTSPPASDLGGTSPRARSDNTWRKMMTRLGTKKRGSPSGKMDRMDE